MQQWNKRWCVLSFDKRWSRSFIGAERHIFFELWKTNLKYNMSGHVSNRSSQQLDMFLLLHDLSVLIWSNYKVKNMEAVMILMWRIFNKDPSCLSNTAEHFDPKIPSETQRGASVTVTSPNRVRLPPARLWSSEQSKTSSQPEASARNHRRALIWCTDRKLSHALWTVIIMLFY